MTIGQGGKYDPECEAVLMATGAQMACVIVVNGYRGTGFALNTTDPSLASMLVGVLRNVADQIEADTQALKEQRR